MPDIDHLMIYPHTFYNVSYSWYCSHSSHYEHSFKKATTSKWPPYPWIFWRWNGNPWHMVLFLHSPQHFGWPQLCPSPTKWIMSIQHSGPWSWIYHGVERKKNNLARKSKMGRIREEAEKLVQLQRESRLIHKWSRTEDGQLGIVWWNREYWDKGMGLKRLKTMENGLKIKKEEPSTPPLHIKVESPPTPCLHYPPSSMLSSHFHSIDPNDFKWSPRYSPSP